MRKNIVAMSKLTDEELILQVQNRDQDAFSELITRWTPRIKGVVDSNSRQRLDAEEIHTDIWVAVWQNIIHLRNMDSFGAWLHRIAYNACKRYYTLTRQSRYEIPHEDSVIVEQIEQQAAARYREKQLMADIIEAVQHLPQKVRSVAELFYLESWHIKEIAVECNLPIGTVKTKLKEIRTLLRKEFDAEVIKGAPMTSKIVQPKNTTTHTHTDKSTINRRPALFNVDTNDPTGDTWAVPEGIIARFGKGNVNDVKLSPDGTYFAVATGLGLWWYDVQAMLPISLWDIPEGPVFKIDFSHDGKWIVIDTVNSIKVMDVETGDCVIQIDEQNGYGGITCSSNGKWIAISDMQGQVNVLDINTGNHIAQMDRGEHKWKANDIHDLTFTPDGTLLAANPGNPKLYSGDKENYNQCVNPDTEGSQIYVWNPETGEALIKFPGNEFVLSSDSCLVAGSSPDETLTDSKRIDSNISVWNISSGEQIALFTEHSDWVYDITFSPCGEYIASSDGILRVWDIATSSEQKVYPDYSDPFYAENGELFAIASQDSFNTLEVWNVEKQEPILNITSGIGGYGFSTSLAIAYTHELNNTPIRERVKEEIPKYEIIHEIQFPWPAPQTIWMDNQTIACITQRALTLWDVNKKSIVNTLYQDEWINSIAVLHSGKLLCSYFTNEGKTLVACSLDEQIAEFPVPEQIWEWVGKIEFAQSGDWMASGSREGNIYLWNLDNTVNTSVLKGHTDCIRTFTFSPNGKQLVSGAEDETVRVWDVKSATEMDRLPMGKPCLPFGLTYSPCGDFVVCDLETEIRFWCADQFTTLRSIKQSKPYRRTYPLAFSHCGRYLAGATWWEKGIENLAVRIWNVETTEEVAALQGHTSIVQFLSFSPDGKVLAGGCGNGTILLWDLESI